eukprot:scaffold2378_cov424-Prasinococcus_capsulatus_cf.AAC.8
MALAGLIRRSTSSRLALRWDASRHRHRRSVPNSQAHRAPLGTGARAAAGRPAEACCCLSLVADGDGGCCCHRQQQ